MRPRTQAAQAVSASLALFLLLIGPATAHEGHVSKPAPPLTAVAGSSSLQARATDTGHPGMTMVPSENPMNMTTQGGQMASSPRLAEPPPKTFSARVMNWIGKWHPMVVHFPIALFLVAGGLELHGRLVRKPGLTEATRVMVAVGALSTLAAVFLGWMAMGWTYGRYDKLHTAHQTLGTAIVLLALATWWAHERWLKARSKGVGALYGLLLTGTVVAIAVNGFLGSSLVRGLKHMSF